MALQQPDPETGSSVLEPTRNAAGLSLASVLGAGIALRIIEFLGRPSLGLDEARVALNVGSRSYLHLLPPLAHDQSAPLLFLWAERLMTDLFGVDDLVLRFVPLAAGIGVVLLAYPVFERLSGRRPALLGSAMVALSPTLIYYSNQAKQYSLEVLVALTLVGLTFPCLGEHRNRRAETYLLVAGVLGVWVSGSAVFMLCAIVAGLLLPSAISPHPGWKLPVTLALPWAGSFLGAYWLIYRTASLGTYMQHFWSAGFLGGSASEFPDRLRSITEQTIWGLLVGVPSPAWGSRAPVLYLVLTGATVGAAVLGIAGMARRNGRSALALTVGPLAAVGGASLLRAYPLVPRLLLFAAPLIYLLVASGVEGAVSALPSVMRVAIRRVMVALILIPAGWLAMLQATAVDPPAHLRQLVEVLRERRVRGEPVYVFAPSIPPWAFYSTDWSSPDTERLSFLERISGAGGPAFENAPSRGHPVAGEGDELVYESKAGKELYGVFTGIEWTPLRGVRKRDPDPGWACNEADRIRAAASPAIWVLMSHLVGSENELLHELERRGGRRTYARTRNDGLLLRFEFPAPGRPD